MKLIAIQFSFRAMLLAGLLVVEGYVASGQKLSDLKEVKVSGSVVGYKASEDHLKIFGYCGYFGEPGVLLVQTDSPVEIENSETSFALIKLPTPLFSGGQFEGGRRRTFSLLRWKPCDDSVRRSELRIPAVFKYLDLPDGQMLPCYIPTKPVRDYR